MVRKFKFKIYRGRLRLDLVLDLDGKQRRFRLLVPEEHVTPTAYRAVQSGKAPTGRSPAVRWAREQAQALIERHESSHGAAATRVKRPDVLRFADFAERFTTEYATLVRAKPATIKGYASNLKYHLLPVLGTLRLDEIGAPEITRILANRRYQPGTLNAVGATLRTMLNWAHELGLIGKPPRIRRFKVPKRKKPEELWFDDDEFEQVLEVAREDVETLVYVLLGADAGLRVGEICCLRWEDVDLEKGILWVRQNLSNGVVVDTPKGCRQRSVPLSRRLAKALREHHHEAHSCVLYRIDSGRADRWTPHVATYRLHRTCKQAGVARAGPHKLRHTCGSRLGALNFPQHEITEFLGHADPKITQVYLHSRTKTQHAMARALG